MDCFYLHQLWVEAKQEEDKKMKRRRLEDLKAERTRIGDIIDDRTLNKLPVWAYVNEYDALTTEIENLETESGT